jgi:hypothetical protein
LVNKTLIDQLVNVMWGIKRHIPRGKREKSVMKLTNPWRSLPIDEVSAALRQRV